MNCVPPLPEFLPGLRALCDKYGALLIIDEVMTGLVMGPAGTRRARCRATRSPWRRATLA